MAPRATKIKGHKPKGEKKKKEEKNGKQLVLKSISTDRIRDIRRLLAVHVEACHLTSYSLAHEVKGTRLAESVEVTAFKPAVLDLVEEEYTEESAQAHVRRFLDIVACTTSFGPSPVGRDSEAKGANQCPPASGESRGAIDEASSDASGGGGDRKDSAAEGSEGFSSRAEADREQKRRSPEAGATGAREGLKEGAGPAEERARGKDSSSSTSLGQEQEKEEKGKLVPFKGKPEAAAAMRAAAEATEKGDMTGMCPHVSKLGQFYEFLSASHLTSPVQSLRRTAALPADRRAAGDFFSFEVRLSTGKVVSVTACREGFYGGKQLTLESTLVGLLQQLSSAFAKAYDDLLDFFVKRNKFGNAPYGFRSNTWLVPPLAAANPSSFPQLPAEDPAWGGDGGGQGKAGEKSCLRDWGRDFSVIAKLPCKTAEERLGRDKKAFLLHSLFVDLAVRRAVQAIDEADLAAGCSDGGDGGKEPASANDASTSLDHMSPSAPGDAPQHVHALERDNLRIVVTRDAPNASARTTMKIDADPFDSVAGDEQARRSLLKGITANESTAVHDTATLATVLVRHRGYSVRVQAALSDSSAALPADVDIQDQPEGGANALNPNSLRTLLHRHPPSPTATWQCCKEAPGALEQAEGFVTRILTESLGQLEKEEAGVDPFLRWELGACWLQHLQNPPTSSGKGEGGDTIEEGKATANDNIPGKSRPDGEADGAAAATATAPAADSEAKAAVGDSSIASNLEADVEDGGAGVELRADVHEGESKAEEEGGGALPEAQAALRDMLGAEAFQRLKDSKTGLHEKSVEELLAGARLFYHETALPKLAAQSEKLPHVRSLCVHEMVTRAFKHMLQASVAAAPTPAAIASIVAACLNAMLGEPAPVTKVGAAAEAGEGHGEGEALGGSSSEESEAAGAGRGEGESPQAELERGAAAEMAELMWRWVEVFVARRYGWSLAEDTRAELRRLAVLRALCLKVGIEMAARTYDLDSAKPFSSADVISMFPIYKALARLVMVCGPYHRMTAGAYSLLAVVLYHTGDFNQKALDINERELGLDHPDTMKSYGDLAVFYYRLQHTELALRYVKRALYLLHLTCGPSHPNTAATYINVAMMEEGLGNVHLALRYLHEALKCNQRLLGADHIQTAASYHAIAIALSLMEAYSLSVQHEQTTLDILQAKLGPDDLRTQDAAAWLDYFDSKAVEQQEAVRTGAPRLDATIASKGHLSVSDLLDFINEEEERSRGTTSRLADSGAVAGAVKKKSKSKLKPKVQPKASGGQTQQRLNESGTSGSSTTDSSEGEEEPTTIAAAAALLAEPLDAPPSVPDAYLGSAALGRSVGETEDGTEALLAAAQAAVPKADVPAVLASSKAGAELAKSSSWAQLVSEGAPEAQQQQRQQPPSSDNVSRAAERKAPRGAATQAAADEDEDGWQEFVPRGGKGQAGSLSRKLPAGTVGRVQGEMPASHRGGGIVPGQGGQGRSRLRVGGAHFRGKAVEGGGDARRRGPFRAGGSGQAGPLAAHGNQQLSANLPPVPAAGAARGAALASSGTGPLRANPRAEGRSAGVPPGVAQDSVQGPTMGNVETANGSSVPDGSPLPVATEAAAPQVGPKAPALVAAVPPRHIIRRAGRELPAVPPRVLVPRRGQSVSHVPVLPAGAAHKEPSVRSQNPPAASAPLTEHPAEKAQINLSWKDIALAPRRALSLGRSSPEPTGPHADAVLRDANAAAAADQDNQVPQPAVGGPPEKGVKSTPAPTSEKNDGDESKSEVPGGNSEEVLVQPSDPLCQVAAPLTGAVAAGVGIAAPSPPAAPPASASKDDEKEPAGSDADTTEDMVVHSQPSPSWDSPAQAPAAAGEESGAAEVTEEAPTAAVPEEVAGALKAGTRLSAAAAPFMPFQAPVSGPPPPLPKRPPHAYHHPGGLRPHMLPAIPQPAPHYSMGQGGGHVNRPLNGHGAAGFGHMNARNRPMMFAAPPPPPVFYPHAAPSPHDPRAHPHMGMPHPHSHMASGGPFHARPVVHLVPVVPHSMPGAGQFPPVPVYQGILRPPGVPLPPAAGAAPPPALAPVHARGAYVPSPQPIVAVQAPEPGSLVGGGFPPLTPVPMNPNALEFVPKGLQAMDPQAAEFIPGKPWEPRAVEVAAPPVPLQAPTSGSLPDAEPSSAQRYADFASKLRANQQAPAVEKPLEVLSSSAPTQGAGRATEHSGKAEAPLLVVTVPEQEQVAVPAAPAAAGAAAMAAGAGAAGSATALAPPGKGPSWVSIGEGNLPCSASCQDVEQGAVWPNEAAIRPEAKRVEPAELAYSSDGGASSGSSSASGGSGEGGRRLGDDGFTVVTGRKRPKSCHSKKLKGVAGNAAATGGGGSSSRNWDRRHQAVPNGAATAEQFVSPQPVVQVR
eukprot:jgi/Mesen1/8600/ME000005S08562